MAEQRAEEIVSLSELTLKILKLPAELLQFFEDRGYSAATLATITKDELEEDLSESTLLVNIDEIFQRIFTWRQDTDFEIISFAEIDVQEEWTYSQNTVSDPEPGSSFSNTRASVILLGKKFDPYNIAVIGEDNTQTFSEEPTPETDTDEYPETTDPSPCQDIKSSNSSAYSSDPVQTAENKLSSLSQRKTIQFCPNQLRSLLESSITGKSLLKRSNQGTFSSQSQKELVEIIAEYHLSLGIKTTEDVLDEYASSIVILFKQEKKVSYYILRCGGKRNPGGKIYNKIFNLKQKRAAREKLEEARESKKLKPSSLVALDIIDDEALIWLQLNIQPWATTLEKWTVSFSKRRHNLQKILTVDTLLKEFRHYKQEYGYQLIDVDFRMLYATQNEGLSELGHSLTRLIAQVSLKYKDDHSSKLVSLLEGVDATEGKS